MDNSAIGSSIECDSTVTNVNDDSPPVIKEFFVNLSINVAKKKWTAKCRFCPTLITDTHKTTSNFLKHLKIKHQSKFNEWKNNRNQSTDDTNQTKINTIFSPDREKYSTSNRRQQQLSNSIVLNLIVSMGLPLSIVDHASFKNFMNDVDPRYKFVSRRDITRSFLPDLQKKCISKLKDICSESKHVSLTLDSWTDRRMRSYFGITLHTIINDEYKSNLLLFDRLHGKHSGEKLAAEFDRVIHLYNLNDRIVRLITDNASNNLAAFDDIVLPGFEEYFDKLEDSESDSEQSDQENEGDEDEDGGGGKKGLQTSEIDDSVYQTTLNAADEDEYLRLPCFSHSLQLVVNDGIKACGAASSSLKKVAGLAKLAHTSTTFAQQLEKVHVTIPKANRTRWNSQFQMVKHVVGIPSSLLNSILTDLKKKILS